MELVQIDSFIATLGTGTVIYALAMWHSGGRQVLGDLPDGFLALTAAQPLGLPVAAFYVLAVALALWLVSEYTPLGRALYVIGANPKAAQLNGIAVRKHVMGAFVASGVLSGFAGVLLASKLQIGQAERRPRVPAAGAGRRLPRLTTIRPGRVNVWGTLVGVAILAIGISGIQQFGGAFFVEPLFNGLTLLVSIGIAGWAQQRRNDAIERRIAQRQLATRLPRRQRCPTQRMPLQNLNDRRRHELPQRRIALAALAALWLGSASSAALADDFSTLRSRRSPPRPCPRTSGTARPPARRPPPARPSSTSPRRERRHRRRHASGVEEAGKAIGWKVRVLNGHGSPRRTAAMNQALALNPSGIVVGGFDALEQNAALEGDGSQDPPRRLAHRRAPAPTHKTGLFANVTTRRRRGGDGRTVGRRRQRRQGRRGDLHQLPLRDRDRQGQAMEADIKKCRGCTVLSHEDSPITETSSRMPS